jgi:hypothetical protein
MGATADQVGAALGADGRVSREPAAIAETITATAVASASTRPIRLRCTNQSYVLVKRS